MTDRELIDTYYAALNARRYDEMNQLIDPDMVLSPIRRTDQGAQEFSRDPGQLPSASEGRASTRRGWRAQMGVDPDVKALRITRTADFYTIETKIEYPNGEVWSGVSIVQIRNGKAYRITEYFGAPFPSAEWRDQWVEKINP